MTLTGFRWIGRAEGVSYLLLLGVGMPLKYAAGRPEAVEWLGWAHGMLFLAYVVALAAAAREQGWGPGRIVMGFVASLLPFGPFVFERNAGAEARATA